MPCYENPGINYPIYMKVIQNTYALSGKIENRGAKEKKNRKLGPKTKTEVTIGPCIAI